MSLRAPDARRRRMLWTHAHRLLVAAGLLPAAGLLWAGFTGGLGADPIERITHVTGEWALRLLVATLAVSPLRRLTGWSALAPWRRSLGLLCFLYAVLHVATWAGLDHGLAWRAAAEDVVERPYITVGFASFLMLAALAATSTRGSVRRLGARRWQALHRLVYVAAVGAVVHFWWGVKADVREPAIYAAVVGALLADRALRALRRSRPARAARS